MDPVGVKGPCKLLSRTQTAKLPDRFDLTWKNETAAAAMLSSQRSIGADTGSVKAPQPDGNPAKNAPEVCGSQVSATIWLERDASPIETTTERLSSLNAGLKVGVSPDVGRRVALLHTAIWQPESKSAQTTPACNGQSVGQQKQETFPFQESKPTGNGYLEVTAVAPSAANSAGSSQISISSQTPKTAPPERNGARPSLSGEAKKSASGSPQAAHSSATVPAPEPPLAAGSLDSGPKHGAGLSSPMLNPGTLSSHTNTGTGLAVEGVHLSTVGAAGVTMVQAIPAHLGTSSARTEVSAEILAGNRGAVQIAHQVVAATPSQLDVGVFDGTHGWLRIHAELGTGGSVSASLTASTAAYESLRAALPELANYLQSEAVTVSKVAVHRVAADPTAMGLADSGQNGSGHGQGSGNGPAQTAAEASKIRPGQPLAHEVHSAWMGTSLVAARPSWVLGISRSGCGSWLNVCA